MELSNDETLRLPVSRRWLVILLCLAALIGCELQFGFARGLFFEYQFRNAFESGERYNAFTGLASSGTYGRSRAREYAGESFRRWRRHGELYVLQIQSEYMDQPRSVMFRLLGKPDEDVGDIAKWYLMRKDLLRMKQKGEITWKFAYGDWDRCLAVRLVDGLSVSICDQLDHQIPDKAPPEPAEWTQR